MYLRIGNFIYKIYIARTMNQKLKGLIGKENINYGLLIPKCNQIHTFFMKENIDVIAIDQFNKVLYKYEDVSPNKIIRIFNKQKNTSILELPKNASKMIKINDILFFENKYII